MTTVTNLNVRIWCISVYRYSAWNVWISFLILMNYTLSQDGLKDQCAEFTELYYQEKNSQN